MIDLVQAQKDLTAILAGADSLANAQCFSFREERIREGELDFHTKLTTPRNGRCGLTVMVCMPRGVCRTQNVTGPIIEWEFPVVVHEMPDVNIVENTGTLVSAEDGAQRVMDLLQLEADEKTGTFRVAQDAVRDEQEFVFPGCVGYRVNILLTAGRSQQTARCGPVVVTVGGVNVTTPSVPAAQGACALSCPGTVGVRIKYSLDGSFPSEDIANNPFSLLYSAPFTLSVGDVLRTAAYLPGQNKGTTRYVQVT